MHYSTEALVWTHFFEKLGKKLDQAALQKWDEDLLGVFEEDIKAECVKKGIKTTKTHRSNILALAVIRSGDVATRVRSAATFYKKVLDEGIINP